MINKSKLMQAVSALLQGNLVIFPTETVYGLGADATNQDAVAKIYKVKNRPTNHPLIVHISSSKSLGFWAKKVPPYAEKLAKDFWPGPMTLILPKTFRAKKFVTGNQNCVGIRVPNHSVARKLLKEFESRGGLGIAAPSANVFGKVSPTSSIDALMELSEKLSISDVVLDGGESQIGIESTIIDCTNSFPNILRPGAVTDKLIYDSISKIISKTELNQFSKNIVRSSGMLSSHYSPNASVILSNSPEEGDGFIALSFIETPKGAIRLSCPKNNEEYARDLYKALRKADSRKIRRVFVIPPEGLDIAVAIRDRLSKISFNSQGKNF